MPPKKSLETEWVDIETRIKGVFSAIRDGGNKSVECTASSRAEWYAKAYDICTTVDAVARCYRRICPTDCAEDGVIPRPTNDRVNPGGQRE